MKHKVMPEGVCRSYKTLEKESKRLEKMYYKALDKLNSNIHAETRQNVVSNILELHAAITALDFARGV